MTKKTKKDPKKKKAEKKKEPGTAMMPREEAVTLTKAQGAQRRALLIQRTLMPRDSSKDELAMFLTFCKRKALDPFTRQVHCMRLQGRIAFGVGIDGLRLVAQRTEQYAPGKTEWKEDAKGNLKSCVVSVFKIVKGEKFEFEGEAFFNEFNQPNSSSWKRMPRHMLSVRAESFALRKGFPAELSGLYTKEEIEDSAFRGSGMSPEDVVDGGGVARAKAALAPQKTAPDPFPKGDPPDDAIESTPPPTEDGVIDVDAETVERNGESVAREAASNSGLFVPTCEKCEGALVATDVDKGKCVNKKCELNGKVVML